MFKQSASLQQKKKTGSPKGLKGKFKGICIKTKTWLNIGLLNVAMED